MTTIFSPESAALRAAARDLAAARRVLVITGAGLSADSGLPTYRGIGGLYERELTDEGCSIEQALSGTMLREQPQLCWKYIAQIEQSCRKVVPNAGHRALAQLQTRYRRFTVLTQNIDGLHADAGSQDLIEIHGSLRELRCEHCGRRRLLRTYAGLESLPPPCSACAYPLRPAVVLFGEMLPEAPLARLHACLSEGVDAVISIGTTSVFPYIAEPVLRAAQAGVPTLEINPGETEVSWAVRHRLRGRAAEVLPALAALLD